MNASMNYRAVLASGFLKQQRCCPLLLLLLLLLQRRYRMAAVLFPLPSLPLW